MNTMNDPCKALCQSDSLAVQMLCHEGKALLVHMDDLAIRQPPHGISGSQVMALIQKAREYRTRSYAPYSHFNVGAAILAGRSPLAQPTIFGGCNVENAAYGSVLCAERTAAVKAVSEGYRDFQACAIVGGFDVSMSHDLRNSVKDDFFAPCGSCRQVLNEFSAKGCLIILAADTDRVLITALGVLLPVSFGPAALGLDPSNYRADSK